MQGDFSRNSDDPDKQYSGVLMQQGRVQLDSDWNEQWRIQTRALRSALRDMIGPYGGPKLGTGFEVIAPKDSSKNYRVLPGVYYVDGIRIEARPDPDAQDGESFAFELEADGEKYLAYLELWERHVNVLEEPELREVALLGPDTCSRAQLLWSVKLLRLKDLVKTTKSSKTRAKADEDAPNVNPHDYEAVLADKFRKPKPILLGARARRDQEPEPCSLKPDARYRGPENQLYRVEIHAHPSPLASPKLPSGKRGEAVLFYFKWSRENASVVFPIRTTILPEDNESSATITVTVQLAHLGRDARYGLSPGDIVEFVDDGLLRPQLVVSEMTQPELGQAGALGCVRKVDPELNEVEVEVFSGDHFDAADASLHPYLRRWDQREPRKGQESHALVRGAVPVLGSDLGVTWFELEDGVEVQFGPNEAERFSRAGDYWTIPARVATGDVIWPLEARTNDAKDAKPKLLGPSGIKRHVAPLALIDFSGAAPPALHDLRYAFEPAAKPLVP